MTEKQGFNFACLCLSVTAAAAAELLLTGGELPSARAVLTQGLVQALLLTFTAAVLTAAFGSCSAAPALRAVLCFCFALELAQTVWQAQSLCWQQFGSKAVIGVVPFLVLYGAARTPAELSRTAGILKWAALAGLAVCAAGLWGLGRWQRLLEAQQWGASVPLYAEYLAAPFICTRRERRRAVWLPLCAFAVQAVFCTGWQLVFGAKEGYASLELLRAMAIGAFSRVDALLVLIWLVLALYRICFLCAAMRCLLAKPHCGEGTPC